MKPRVLILYYSFTHQTRRVADAMAEVFDELGWEVERCNIEFIDERYRIELPFRPVIRNLLSWLPAQVLGKTCAVHVPEEVVAADYDLICLGSPTWWLNPAMPVVSFLKSSRSRQSTCRQTIRGLHGVPQTVVEQHAARQKNGQQPGRDLCGRRRPFVSREIKSNRHYRLSAICTTIRIWIAAAASRSTNSGSQMTESPGPRFRA